MALRKIFKEGEGVVERKSREVEKFDRKLRDLLDDLRDTVRDAGGAGLASPQVGILRRAAVVDAEDTYLELVNPVIIAAEGEQIDMEGCLSVDDSKDCLVRRPRVVTVRACDREGKVFEKTLEGFAARVVCHELDHLDGILFYTREYKKNKETDK